MAKQQFLVIGVGRFGSALAKALFQQGHEVIVVDNVEEKVDRITDYVTHALIADATDEDVLRGLGVSNFDLVVVAIGHDFEANILVTVSAKNLGARRVIAKAASDVAATVLKRVGADEVIQPERDMGLRLAQQLATPNLIDAFTLGRGHAVIEVEAHERLLGSLAKLRLTNRFQVQVIAVHRASDVIVSPRADFEIRSGDKVVLIGSNEAVKRFRSYLAEDLSATPKDPRDRSS